MNKFASMFAAVAVVLVSAVAFVNAGICNNPCEHREAGYKVADCEECPKYYECKGTGPNDYEVKSCARSYACMREVIQRCAPSCSTGERDCYDDAVLGGGDAVDPMDIPQAVGNMCPTGPAGVRSCKGKPDGDYQSCISCNHYISCRAGKKDGGQRPCPSRITWDDNKKRCEWRSTTCFVPLP